MKPITLILALLLLAPVARAESLYDRVMTSGKIRAAYVVYPPSCIKDPNTGKLSGIFIEAVEKAAENLQLKVEWTEEVSWTTMIPGLEANRYDIVGNASWPNSSRARVADFSTGLYFVPVSAYGRADEKRFIGKFQDINNPAVKIATIDGATTDHIARTVFPDAHRFSLPEGAGIPDLFVSVASSKADVVVIDTYSANEYMKHNTGKLKALDPAHPVKVFPNVIIFKRGEFEFKNMINRAFEELINSGYIDTLMKKYVPEPGVLMPVALPYRPKP